MTRPAQPPREPAQYGEYASPEDQERARGVDAGRPSGPLTSAPLIAAPLTPARSAAGISESGPPASRAVHKHPVDRIVTLVLLALGLFTLVTSIPGYLAMPDAMQTVYEEVGAGTYSARDLAASLGVTALIIQAIVWLAAGYFSSLSLKRGRYSWWIPVVGAALAFIALMIIVSVALMADPGLLESVSPGDLP